MSMKKRLLPFWLMPASWGLKGRSKQIAQAEYYLEGEELEYEILKIHYNVDPDGECHDYLQEKNDLDHKFGKIDDFDHAMEKINISHNYDKITDDEYTIQVAELKYSHERIGKDERDKTVAKIKGEPYVNVLSMGIDDQNVSQGYIELDWNEEFVKALHEAGYTGTSDEDVVNQWFNSICRTVLLQSAADLDFGLEEMIPRQQERPDVIRKSDLGDPGKNSTE